MTTGKPGRAVCFSYPDGAQDSNGLIRIIYDHERYKEGDILMAAFREDDILAGSCRSPDAGLRIPVNRFITPVKETK